MKVRVPRVLALFCDEPFRLFFPLGILIGFVGASHWLFYSLGWIPSYSGFFHASVQTQGYMSSFVAGFLLTAIPRFSSTPRASIGELITFLILSLANVTFLSFQNWIAGEVCFLAWLTALARFIGIRMAKRFAMRLGSGQSKQPSNSPPVEFVWIPIAILHGFIGTSLLILSQLRLIPPWIGPVGFDMWAEGFILAIVVGVGGFLAPRLMGRFQTVKSSDVCTAEEMSHRRRGLVLFHVLAGLIFFLSFWLEFEGAEMLGHGLRALVVTFVLVRTRSLPYPPRVADFFAWLIWISMWMVLLGNWLTALFPAYEKATLHLMFLGGFSLMTFSVGTTVTLSHAGEAHLLHRQLFILWLVAIGIACALGFRIAAVFIPNLYFQLLGIAAVFWIFVAASWLCFIVPRVVRIPEPGVFEHQHEEMKRRVAE